MLTALLIELIYTKLLGHFSPYKFIFYQFEYDIPLEFVESNSQIV